MILAHGKLHCHFLTLPYTFVPWYRLRSSTDLYAVLRWNYPSQRRWARAKTGQTGSSARARSQKEVLNHRTSALSKPDSLGFLGFFRLSKQESRRIQEENPGFCSAFWWGIPEEFRGCNYFQWTFLCGNITVIPSLRLAKTVHNAIF